MRGQPPGFRDIFALTPLRRLTLACLSFRRIVLNVAPAVCKNALALFDQSNFRIARSDRL